MSPVAPMPCGAAVGTNGLKSSVMELSGELSMTNVFDLDELLLFDDPDEPHAPSPIASRPAVANAASPLCVRSFALMVTFLSPSESIPDSWGCELTDPVLTPFARGVERRRRDVKSPARSR